MYRGSCIYIAEDFRYSITRFEDFFARIAAGVVFVLAGHIQRRAAEVSRDSRCGGLTPDPSRI